MEVEQTFSIESSKKQCTSTSTNEKKPTISVEHILNFPIADRGGKACHIKVYKDADKLKINDICEFIGFLSVDPALKIQISDDYDDEMEIQTHNPSPSLVPRIHCVTWKKLIHNNPLINEVNIDLEKLSDTKKELQIILTQLMLGDELAAEYLLYHLISTVYLRQDFLALGKFTLNLSQIPIKRVENFGGNFYKFLELFVPKSHYLPMSLENMNELTFIPKKDYQSNRLTSGLLQLSSNTHLILDETKLTAGKLNSAAVKSVSALTKIINHQIVEYDFNFYQMEYNCDIPVLILSEGKSMLPVSRID